ncbi:MAG: mechanosensitive ion channel [Legionella sp.]
MRLALDDSKHIVLPKNEKEYLQKTEEINSIVKMTRIKIDNLEGFLEQQDKEQNALNQRLKQLQQLPITKEGMTIEERVAKVQALLEANKQTTQLINDDLALAKEFQTSLQDEIWQLQYWHNHFVLEQKLIAIKSMKDTLHQKLSTLYQNNIPKQQLAKASVKKVTALVVNGADYETRTLVNNQYIATIQYHLNALSAQKMIVKADLIYLKNPDIKNLQMITEIYHDALSQYNHIEKSLQQITTVLNNEINAARNAEIKRSISFLQNTLKQLMAECALHKQTTIKNLTNYQAQLKRLISSRQTLADYNISSWPIIVKKIAAIPGLFYKYVKTLSLKVYDSYLWLSPVATAMLWGSFALIAGLFFMLSRFLKTLRGNKERSRLTGYLYDGILVLIQRNIPYLCATAMLWTLFYITHIVFANYQLVLQLIAVWFTFRVSILIARLVLLESISDSSGKDVKLYYRLKWLLLFGGWTTSLMTLGHLLPLSLLLQDIFNRLFMLFMLTVSLVAWKSRDVIRYLVWPLLKNKKRYIHNAISLLILLVPITVFTTAVIGLLGFINLAWTMSRYQANALIVLVGYILARGLLFDALELFSEWMISSLRNGWLWIEVFLKPADKIVRMVLIIVSSLILCKFYGWNSDSLVITSLEKFAQYTIVNIPGIHVTVASTVAFLMLLAIFVWAAKWTREFCYRWLFINTKDPGLRNSLSVFSQYTVILIGGVVTLHVLGFDFSGMSMIIGGLAVGMGFGLRDFASNIVGGLMLLIERPVREGDLVTIGEHEGQVAHIGIRCMRVSSWDNMEVLIPNAETFNKPFTNWTHQDGIVRSVIPIKVSRSDDPVIVQQLIFDVLATTPEIVGDPPAQVFLKKIDEALLEFEVRYFVDVQIHTRFEVQSKVLFAIMAQFKAANIKPPIEPISIELKEGYAGLTSNKSSSKE